MFGRKKSNVLESNFELQITALIDTLVIILIFLLKSIATETLDIEQTKNLTIPSVTDGVSKGLGNRLSISKDAIEWNNAAAIKFSDFSELGKNKDLWRPLEDAIAKSATQDKANNKFDEKLFLQADKNIPYSVLSFALKIAKQHGYKDIRFVGVKYN